MTRAQRTALLVGAVVVAVAAFLILRPSDDEPANQSNTPAPNGSTAKTNAEEPSQPKAPLTRIRVRGGQPVGGEADLKLTKGDTVRLAITSDVTDQVHVHGYDLSRPVGPGQPVRIRFKATIEGAFEIELEERGVPIAQLEVSP